VADTLYTLVFVFCDWEMVISAGRLLNTGQFWLRITLILTVASVLLVLCGIPRS